MNTLANVIANFIDKKVNDINTLDVAIVDSINDENNTLNISLLRVYDTFNIGNFDQSSAVPVIKLLDVPVMRPMCKNFSIEPDYTVGDRVLVAYTKKDIYSQLTTDSAMDMNCSPNFSVRNAVVIGTIAKWGNSLPTAESGNDVLIQHSSGSSIKFGADGSVTITGSRISFKQL